MGSCSCKSIEKSPKVIASTTGLCHKHKIRQHTILRLRQDLQIRRFIYLTKDFSVPNLNITKSDLYLRRRKILPSN